MTKLSCGACNLCCKLLGVPDIHKPARMLCWHTGVHGGCAVQAQKSTDENLLACAQFKCLWLASQDREEAEKRHPRAWRPDVTHVVMGPFDREDRTLLYIQVDPGFPEAWKQEPVASYLDDIVARGGKVEIIVDEMRISLTQDGLGVPA